MTYKKHLNILVSGGGTGGHFYPAMAIAGAVEKQLKDDHSEISVNIHYVGSRFGMETRLLKEYNYDHTLLPIRGFLRYFSFFALKQNLLFPFRILRSLIICRRVFKSFRPDAVIASGGYACGIPGWLASRRHIPLFIQEQNAFPGITTRSLAAHASCLYYAYNDVLKHFQLPDSKVLKSGNPVRSNIVSIPKETACSQFHLDPARPIIFIFGGSQGALNVNRHIAQHLSDWLGKYDLQILWQTGERSWGFLNEQFAGEKGVHLHKYIYDMSSAYSAADCVISRAGALTLAEIQKMKLPAILVPLPTAAGNHQYYNALALQKISAAIIVEEKDFSKNPMEDHLDHLMQNTDALKGMQSAHAPEHTESAECIAGDIINRLYKLKDWDHYGKQ